MYQGFCLYFIVIQHFNGVKLMCKMRVLHARTYAYKYPK